MKAALPRVCAVGWNAHERNTETLGDGEFSVVRLKWFVTISNICFYVLPTLIYILSSQRRPDF